MTTPKIVLPESAKGEPKVKRYHDHEVMEFLRNEVANERAVDVSWTDEGCILNIMRWDGDVKEETVKGEDLGECMIVIKAQRGTHTLFGG